MSAAVPSGRRITGGLLKGYFIRTSSSYPAYPREFPAGVRKSCRHSPFFSPHLLLFVLLLLRPVLSRHSDSYRRQKIRGVAEHALFATFRSGDSSRKMRERARRYVKSRIYDASYDGVLRNGNLFLEHRFILRATTTAAAATTTVEEERGGLH